MATEKLGRHNPGLYREMSKPFSSKDDAVRAIHGFMADMYEMRKRHRVADFITLCRVCYVEQPGGPEIELAVRLHVGDQMRALPMAAQLYGTEREHFEAMIGQLLPKDPSRISLTQD